MRPKQLIGVLGTHTEVGKTYVLSHWLASLRERGVQVAARKPVQSFSISDSTTDARQLSIATGEPIDAVCQLHRCYPLALAPPMAADQLHMPPIFLNDLCADIRWDSSTTLGVVETVGGPLSPIAHDGDSIDLLRALSVDHIILVADAQLGALNAVRLCLRCCDSIPVTVFLNRFTPRDELHELNRLWLTERYGVCVAVNFTELTTSIVK